MRYLIHPWWRQKVIIIRILCLIQNAYGAIDRHGMWQTLGVYGVRGKLVKAAESFYVDSRACVRLGVDASNWFPG